LKEACYSENTKGKFHYEEDNMMKKEREQWKEERMKGI